MKSTTRATACIAVMFVSAAASAQSPNNAAASTGKFEIADVHPAAKSTFRFARNPAPPDGRCELTNVSIVDLIRLAYGFPDDEILGGPGWLEMDRFDITAKEPRGTTADTRRPMLQSLLADRFGLVVRRETRPMPAFALVARNPHLKQAGGAEETGCRTKPASGQAAQSVFIDGPNGLTAIDLGPGMTFPYVCRNITMAAFAEALPQMLGTSFGSQPVIDRTGLKGAWNFDVKWSMPMYAPDADPGARITVADAIAKQLGLKLEDRWLPTPVIVVEKVNRTPTENSPGVAEALLIPRVATEFEVAVIKPSGPFRGVELGLAPGDWVQPGGRFIARHAGLLGLVAAAFDTLVNRQAIVGLPDWANTEQFDIDAKVPEGTALSMLPTPLRALLVDRFKMKYHTEDRPVSAYSLVSVKPKLIKADPASRASCKDAAVLPNNRSLTCRNVTMAQFAGRLQNLAPELNWPVLDETGIEGTWDFALTFSRSFGPAGRGAPPPASDPTGALTIFEAVQKQLGLKLESRKRPEPVVVIDHIEQQPTEN